jgi:hypothetical protein
VSIPSSSSHGRRSRIGTAKAELIVNYPLNCLGSSLLIAISCWVELGRPRPPSIRLFVSVPPNSQTKRPLSPEDAAAEEDAYTQPLSSTYLLAHPLLMTERERKLRLMLSGPRADEPVALINQLGHLRKLATAEGHAALLDALPFSVPNAAAAITRSAIWSTRQRFVAIICLKEQGRQIRVECWKGGEWEPALLWEGLVAACAPGAVAAPPVTGYRYFSCHPGDHHSTISESSGATSCRATFGGRPRRRGG